MFALPAVQALGCDTEAVTEHQVELRVPVLCTVWLSRTPT